MLLHEAFLSSFSSSDPREARYLADRSIVQVGQRFRSRLRGTICHRGQRVERPFRVGGLNRCRGNLWRGELGE
jgi:hypothetical protein